MTYRLFSLILAGLLALPCADAGAEALEPGQHAAEAAKESFRAKRAEAAGLMSLPPPCASSTQPKRQQPPTSHP